MLPPIIPIFPLPNVVLFPNVFLPLHIFEPRYREMVADALAGDRLIGMVLLRPGWETNYDGRPPVYQTGCAGLVTHADRLDDGCYNIILRGLEKFRIRSEEGGRAYRCAHVEPLLETCADQEREAIRSERHRLEALLAPLIERRTEPLLPSSMPDDDLVNALAQYLQLEPLEKQALLERHGVLERCQSLVELLEMKVMAAHQAFRTAG
ncbi:MAG: LON peptidase substrate-binding domain-containing protein [Acidobacteria bacterium]|nr:LON peptidase substrate-binding domain-containing protein [Acidobacteriota bacterium]